MGWIQKGVLLAWKEGEEISRELAYDIDWIHKITIFDGVSELRNKIGSTVRLKICHLVQSKNYQKCQSSWEK